MSITRRLFISVCALIPISAHVAAKEFPRVPTDWDPQEMFEQYEKLAAKGNGVHWDGPQTRPKAYIAIDTQCPWCIKLVKACEPLRDKIDIVFMPVALLKIHSEPQGALILSASDKMAKLMEHEEHFRDPDFRGLKYDKESIPVEKREAIWENTKVHRKTGCRLVPYGVFKTASGKYNFIDSQMKTKDLKAVFELK